jgi:hypothetical protein
MIGAGGAGAVANSYVGGVLIAKGYENPPYGV